MKKIVVTLLFLSANIEKMFARTGTISGDEIIIWLPVLILILAWMVYKVKAKLRERKNAEAAKVMEPGTEELKEKAE